jgi:hypothetical protein
MFLQYKRETCAGLVVLAALSMGSIRAQAQSEESPAYGAHGAKSLDGDYGLVTIVSCAYSTPQAPGVASINSNTGEFLVNGQPINLSGSGIMTFKPNGTLTLNANGAQVETSDILAGQTPFVSGFLSICDGSYSISDAGKQLSLSFNCAITVPGQPVKLNVGPVKWDGFIGHDALQIHLNGEQNVQTIAISLASTGQQVQEQQRICLQVSSLDKL